MMRHYNAINIVYYMHSATYNKHNIINTSRINIFYMQTCTFKIVVFNLHSLRHNNHVIYL